MYTDLDEKMVARRLNSAANESGEAPYDWDEFQRRRRRSRLTQAIERNRTMAIAASILAAVLVIGAPFVRSIHQRGPVLAPPGTATTAQVGEVRTEVGQMRATRVGGGDSHEVARTRAIEGWLAGLPHDHVIVRVGTHAAVTGLQDQIAALDDLMSAERVSGAKPSRLQALERQRAQLVSSLAQLQYAEMLASATS